MGMDDIGLGTILYQESMKSFAAVLRNIERKRISYRRKYVNLYRMKLDAIRQEYPVDKEILEELEQMEKESEIEDILTYRSAAECQLQGLVMVGMVGSGVVGVMLWIIDGFAFASNNADLGFDGHPIQLYLIAVIWRAVQQCRQDESRMALEG
ncbi:hypothetical protein ACLOJK_006354 [Asimina triloba]